MLDLTRWMAAAGRAGKSMVVGLGACCISYEGQELHRVHACRAKHDIRILAIALLLKALSSLLVEPLSHS